MYCDKTIYEWNLIDPKDLWVYNKLFLSRTLGYNCGPSGVPVPKSDFYIVRPSFNIRGMGIFSRIEYIDSCTEFLHPAEFWCEIFEGDHLSVDFYCGECSLVVKGIRQPDSPLYKWEKWEKIDDKKIEFPSLLRELKGTYEWINCEFIGDKLIEVHFRRNPNFKYNNSVAIPIWNDENIPLNSKYEYIEDKSYLRKGFLIR